MNKFTAKNPNFEDSIKEHLKGQHFMRLMGFDLTSIEAGHVIGKMPIEQKHKQQIGFVHGGVTATILDITMGFSAYSLVPENKAVVTANISVDYFNPGIGDTIVAEGRVDKIGGKLAFCSGEVYVLSTDKKTCIAKARSVMAIMDKST